MPQVFRRTHYSDIDGLGQYPRVIGDVWRSTDHSLWLWQCSTDEDMGENEPHWRVSEHLGPVVKINHSPAQSHWHKVNEHRFWGGPGQYLWWLSGPHPDTGEEDSRWVISAGLGGYIHERFRTVTRYDDGDDTYCYVDDFKGIVVAIYAGENPPAAETYSQMLGDSWWSKSGDLDTLDGIYAARGGADVALMEVDVELPGVAVEFPEETSGRSTVHIGQAAIWL